MALTISNAGAGLMVSALGKSLNDGFIRVYATSQPSNVEASAHGTIIACARAGDPIFAAFRDTNPGALVSANGLPLVCSAATSGNINNGYFRIHTSAGTGVVDGTVTSAGGAGQATVDNPDVDQDVQFSITTLTLTQPES